MTRKLGATGEFPRGKFCDEDEGGLRMAMAIRDKTIIVNFGKPVAWIGLDLESAEAFREALDASIKKLKEVQ